MAKIERYFPSGSIKVTPKELNCVIGLYEYDSLLGGVKKHYFGVIGYSGKRSKPDIYYRYLTLEARDKGVSNYLKQMQSVQDYKNQVKKNRILKNNLVQVGDIFYTSWGYDQTNVEFYQVLELKGQFATIRQICCDYNETGFMSGMKTAASGAFVENFEPMRKRILTYDGGKSVNFKITDCQTAWQWDGQPKYSSYYA